MVGVLPLIPTPPLPPRVEEVCAAPLPLTCRVVTMTLQGGISLPLPLPYTLTLLKPLQPPLSLLRYSS
ncbi:hypothetical protein EON65_47580 [archaeon]|nr:MAG: hypothetical protein EON65_47580 [archaeon]